MIRFLIGAATLSVLASTACAQQDDRPLATPGTAVTLDQLSTRDQGRPGKAARDSDLDVAQPSPPSRSSAVTSNEISTPADGRALATPPMGGADRCDPAVTSRPTDPCRHLIESRADDYTRPRPASVSPEARLLLLLNPNRAVGGSADGGRQLGTAAGSGDSNAPAAQIAGALQDQAAVRDSLAATARATAAGAPAANAPAIVLTPTK